MEDVRYRNLIVIRRKIIIDGGTSQRNPCECEPVSSGEELTVESPSLRPPCVRPPSVGSPSVEPLSLRPPRAVSSVPTRTLSIYGIKPMKSSSMITHPQSQTSQTFFTVDSSVDVNEEYAKEEDVTEEESKDYYAECSRKRSLWRRYLKLWIAFLILGVLTFSLLMLLVVNHFVTIRQVDGVSIGRVVKLKGYK